MEKYLINVTSITNRYNQVFCVDDYGVETEIIPTKWYSLIEESDQFFKIKNEWGEIENYSKKRFKRQKENLPL